MYTTSTNTWISSNSSTLSAVGKPRRLPGAPETIPMGADAHPSEVYTEQLQTLREGDALWFPEPHTSGEVQIGDVGCIVEGAFIRLFNVISPDEFPVPDSDLPEGFELLKAPRVRHMDIRDRALAPGHHNSKSVVCTRVEASASACVKKNQRLVRLNCLPYP